MNTHHVIWEIGGEAFRVESDERTAQNLYDSLRHNPRIAEVAFGRIMTVSDRYRRIDWLIERANGGRVSIVQRDGETYLDCRNRSGRREWFKVAAYHIIEVDCPF